MKLILWLVVSMMARTAAEAAASTAESVSVEDLRSALKKYQGMETLDVDFKQTKILKDMDFKVESEGRMSIRMPDQVRWQVTKPSPLKVELNREEITVESSSGTNRIEAAAIPPNQRQEFKNMMNWLKLDADAISQSYLVSKLGPRSFAFAAKEAGSLFKTMELVLNTAGHVHTVKFKEKSEDEMLMTFGKPKVKYSGKK